jgi:hypothetical protein
VLFITKIILNRPTIFQPYYSHWFGPLLELCLTPAIGKGVNYFFRDVLLLLLQWPQARPTDSHQEMMASRLMDLLIRYAYYPSNEIVKSNVDIFKLFVERWKGTFQISKVRTHLQSQGQGRQIVETYSRSLTVSHNDASEIDSGPDFDRYQQEQLETLSCYGTAAFRSARCQWTCILRRGARHQYQLCQAG